MRFTIVATCVLIVGGASCGAGSAAIASGSSSNNASVVHNNAPTVEINGEALAANLDNTGGIPVSFTVRDDEADDASVVVQWKSVNQLEFPALPTGIAALRAALGDQRRRAELQIATEAPITFKGRIALTTAGEVRLDEIRSGAIAIRDDDIVGLDLDLLSSLDFEGASARWLALGVATPLESPVAVLPLDDSPEAIVVDQSPTGWRMRSIELSSGKVTGESSGAGNPKTAALINETELLVGVDFAGRWEVHHVNISTGLVTILAADSSSTPDGEVQDLVGSPGSALLLVEDFLLRIRWREIDDAIVSIVIGGLDSPGGVALDSLNPGHALVTETDPQNGQGLVSIVTVERRNRIVLELDNRIRAPGSIAVDTSGRRLLIVSEDPSGDPELNALSLDRSSPLEVTQLLGSQGPILTANAKVAVSRDGRVVLAIPEFHDLIDAGGIAQRRKIDEFDRGTGIVSLDQPFLLPPALGQIWSVTRPSQVASVPTDSGPRVFLWDSRDLRDGGAVTFRAAAFDTQLGASDQTLFPHLVSGDFSGIVEQNGAGNSKDPTRIVVADFDGDGLVDALTALPTKAFVFANGAGGFDNGKSVSEGNIDQIVDVDVGDFNGDGFSDFVICDRGFSGTEANLIIAFNRGGKNPNFDLDLVNSAIAIPSDAEPVAVAAADFTGDGRLDLAVADVGSATVRFFEQAATGSLVLSTESSGFVSPAGVDAGDLSGDGTIDLVVADRDAPGLGILIQVAGGFPSIATPVVFDDGSGPNDVALGDLDLDGDLDIASANTTGNHLAVVYQLANGEFSVQRINGNGQIEGPLHVGIIDIDLDGLPDLVTTSPERNRVVVVPQSAPGFFSNNFLEIGDSSTMHRPVDVAISDFDHDGQLDLAIANEEDRGITVLFRPQGGIITPQISQIGSQSTTPRVAAVLTRDVDGDGLLDIVTASKSADNLLIQFQDAARVFSITQVELRPLAIDPDPSSIAAGDLNGDGLLDLVSGNLNGFNLSVFHQTAARTFGPETTIGDDLTTAPQDVAVFDFRGDGQLDIGFVATGSVRVGVFTPDPDGEFGNLPSISSTAPLGPVALIAADFDGDGKVDIATGNSSGKNISILTDNGSATLTSKDVSVSNSTVSDLAAVDFNGDGQLDLVVSNQFGSSVSLLEGDGALGFSVVQTRAFTAGLLDVELSGIASGDLDGDGDFDIALTRIENAGAVADSVILLFLEDGRIEDQRLFSGFGIAVNPTAIEIADLDGDGDADVVSTSDFEDRVTIIYGGS